MRACKFLCSNSGSNYWDVFRNQYKVNSVVNIGIKSFFQQEKKLPPGWRHMVTNWFKGLLLSLLR